MPPEAEPQPIEEETLWRLPFKGWRVWRVGVSVRLEVDLKVDQQGSNLASTISVNGALFCGPEGAPLAMDPESADRAELGPALNLFFATVSDALAYKSGRLEVRFVGGRPGYPVDGWVLRADPDERYEAWEVRGPGRQLIVCGHGGELAMWSGDSLGTVGELARRGFFEQEPFRGVFKVTRNEPPG